jgi:hypothetical protein
LARIRYEGSRPDELVNIDIKEIDRIQGGADWRLGGGPPALRPKPRNKYSASSTIPSTPERVRITATASSRCRVVITDQRHRLTAAPSTRSPIALGLKHLSPTHRAQTNGSGTLHPHLRRLVLWSGTSFSKLGDLTRALPRGERSPDGSRLDRLHPTTGIRKLVVSAKPSAVIRISALSVICETQFTP